MKSTAALAYTATALLLAACSEPPPVDSASPTPAAGTSSGAPAAPGAAAPVSTDGAAAAVPAAASPSPTGKLVAGVGYDPKLDPLVRPPSLTEPYDAAKATEDDWLFVSLDGAPRTLNPVMGSSTYEFMVNSFLYDGPFTFDDTMTWKLNDVYAEKLDISPDRKTWTLTLKPGLKWQDGEPFTAHDIEFSYREIMDPHVVTVQRSGTDELESVKALDDLTVQYVHKEPLPTSKWNVNFSILPKHVYDRDLEKNPDLKSGDFYAKVNREGLGNGPYRLLEWVEGDKIVLERWDGYSGPKPHFKRIVCRIVPDSNVRLLTFEKGELDEMYLTQKQFADDTVRDPAFGKVGVKALGREWGYSYISWVARGNPFFGDARVRRAMTMACNIPLMLKTLVYNLTEQARGPYHPDSWMYNPDVKLLPFDLDAAGKLLDEAGWKVSEQDGWRSKDGTKFSFTLLIPQGIQISADIAAIFQQDLRSIGVEMKTQTIEWAAMQEKVRKHECQASIAGWGTGVDPDLGWNLWHSEMIDQEGGRNYSCYANPKVDQILVAGRHEFDEAKRKALYQELQKIIYEDQPYTFLWYRPTTWAFNKRIRGVVYSPRGVWNFDPSYLAWWVAKTEQAHGMK